MSGPFTLSAQEMAQAFGGRLLHGPADRLLPSVSIDTRTLQAGDLFVAIRGPRFDGHAFVADAVARGAGAVVVADASAAPATTVPTILVDDTLQGLQRLSPDEVNALAGREVVFRFRDRQIPFTAENFVLSFSLPNFYFHATTAYDLLRAKGVPLAKRDFLGQLRIKS